MERAIKYVCSNEDLFCALLLLLSFNRLLTFVAETRCCKNITFFSYFNQCSRKTNDIEFYQGKCCVQLAPRKTCDFSIETFKCFALRLFFTYNVFLYGNVLYNDDILMIFKLLAFTKFSYTLQTLLTIVKKLLLRPSSH